MENSIIKSTMDEALGNFYASTTKFFSLYKSLNTHDIEHPIQ
jgi:hypothetical protein